MKPGNIDLLDLELASTSVTGRGEEEIQLLRNLVLAVRRKIVFVFIGALLAAVIAVAFTFTMTKTYTATVRIMLNTRVNADTTYTPDVSGLPITLTTLESETEVLRSTDLIERVVIKLDLQNNKALSGGGGFSLSPRAFLRDLFSRPASNDGAGEGIDLALEETIKLVSDSETVEQLGANSAVYAVRMTAANRFLAAEMANTLAKEYLDTQTADKIRSLERAQGWLTLRTQQLQVTINDLVNELEGHLIESPFSLEEYATIKAQRQITERQFKAEEKNLLKAEGLMAEIQAFTEEGMLLEAARILPFASDRVIAALALSEGGMTASLKALLSEEIASGLERLIVQISDIEARMMVSSARVLELQADQELQAEHEGETRRIENEITVNETIYKDFVSQLSRRLEQNDYLDSDGRIIEFARPPTRASAPRRSQTGVVTFVLVFIFGIAIVLFREIYQNKLRTVYELESVTGLTLLGFLPNVGKDVDLINNPDNPELLQFVRKLRVSLSSELPAPVVTSATRDGNESVTKRAAIIAGTSALPSEGVSSSLFLLATTFARSGEKVLLLDCNFWNSAYAHIGHEPVESLARIGARPALVSNQVVPMAVPGLYVLPALFDKDTDSSENNITDFFNSRAFSVLIENLCLNYDRIIIDTPPLLPVVDSVSILAHADLVLYFVQWNSTPAGAVESAVRILADINAKVEFCVATRVKLGKIAKYGDASMSFAGKVFKNKGY